MTLFLVLLAATAFVLLPASVRAQTVNPHTVTFAASVDQNTLDANGQPVVTGYDLEFYQSGGSQAVQTLNLGKPAPAADGTITVDFSTMLSSVILPGQQLDATVTAVGPSGRGESSPSNTFIFNCNATLSPTALSATYAGGSSSVSVAIYNGCTWQATSTTSWITITSGAGTGNGTVAFTIAANPNTTTRTGTFTVAGQTVTVTQAAAPAPNVAPSVSVTSPTNGATFTAPASIPIGATASDSDGNVTTLAVYANGSTLLGSSATGSLNTAWNVITAGTYTITAKATDNSGATTTSSAVTVTVTAPDTTAPSVAITTPTSSGTYSCSTTPVTIGGTASDNVGVTQVTWANSLGGSGTATGTTNWAASVPLQVGANVITVTARDAAGNTKTATLTASYTTANTPPSVSITSPVNGAKLIVRTATAIKASASDTGGISGVAFYANQTLIGTATSAPYSIAWTPNATGVFTLTAVATDNLGLTTTSAPVSVTVTKRNGK